MTTSLDILIVEDRAEDAELAMMALQENNIAKDIRWVKDGLEALDLLIGSEENGDLMNTGQTTLPKLILLDLNMPRLGGIDLLKRLKNHKNTRSIPVVVLTTSDQEGDVSLAYSHGANSYIVKPVEFDQFEKSVRNIGEYWLSVNYSPLIREQ